MSENWLKRYKVKINSTQDEKDELDDFDLFFSLSELNQEVNVDAAWVKLEQKIERKTPAYLWLLRIAAVAIFGFFSSYFIYQTITNQENIQTAAIYQAETAKKEILLPDGSLVTLAPNSNISFDESDFSKSRNIKLIGKAFFEVKKNGLPFTVKTEQGSVKVLGTSFSVDVSSSMSVTVATGLVEVNSGKSSQLLKPGQNARLLSDNSINVTSAKDTNELSWISGVFYFENQSFDEVIPLLEEYYNVKITANKSLRTCKLTAEFNESSLENVVKVISKVLNAHAKVTTNKVKFSGKGCN
ncbi:MAG: transmembrane sensor [Marinoscillum sp.]|jgi:transmembrane sensor